MTPIITVTVLLTLDIYNCNPLTIGNDTCEFDDTDSEIIYNCTYRGLISIQGFPENIQSVKSM